ncbi:2-oxo acid dehydrogenase subunit E2 [Pseudomonadales bacterium]|jgi:pyruvate/2-oxoglutarate dehydrogenase complex dihydrolipoamide acyltransferase (E2) component|nr:2-oxo acid dehydrogenase subunit E2 [Gammaproteobacteria bacterium]MBT3733828.1 2-oxo acid dehydrogenase subunit E2 [Gammaproteobacteria bacterium]MBT7541934.1 2-oxo acid dehydrogenase subunit E2 [Gammaproteobacteria bacterium]MDC1480677.1 2-oxo acid dehydrogenase subunit E2 [Pseudomonadales bacterium]|tara:strand:- start:9163 stop:10533 length:1371 start_codon:yes stop_codon:yes gene_type:complete
MPREIYLVKVGMTMTEGMVSEWFIADGAEVKKGEMLYALETEKVNLDVDAEADGTVKHLVEAGVTLEPGDVVGYIFAQGESIPDVLPGATSQPEVVVSAEPVAVESAAPMAVEAAVSEGFVKASPAAKRLAKELDVNYLALQGTGPGGRIVEADVQSAASGQTASQQPAVAAIQSQSSANIKASPLAKRIAEQRAIDLSQVRGTGPGGRIVQSDVENLGASIAQASGPAAGDMVPVKGMRKTIAQRMHQSLQESAQLTMDMAAVMDDAVKLREQLIREWDGAARPTFTDLVIKAAAKALQKHPLMNSQFGGTGIQLLNEIHVGIAVALPEGLVVPVVRHADQLSLKEIAIESARLATSARNGTLGLDDYAGGTFTISALGMFGVDSFTPIINQPQSGILGVNRILDGVAWEGETPVRQKQMNLSLTWDHRVLDGAPAAEFLQTVVEYLSEPYRLLV